MIHATIQLFLYALLAGFSALAFAATIALMQAGRLKTLGFGTGFVLGQVFTCSLFVIVGVVVTGASKRTHSALIATLELLLALLLIAVAVRVPRAPPVETEGSSVRTQAVLERLSRMRFLTTSIAGFCSGLAARNACCSPRLPRRRSPPRALAADPRCGEPSVVGHRPRSS
jgi:hypothetical protein